MIKKIFTYAIRILLLFAFIWGFKWLGIQGIIGLFIGFIVMAWVFLSQNETFLMFVKLFDLLVPKKKIKERTKVYSDELLRDTRDEDRKRFG